MTGAHAISSTHGDTVASDRLEQAGVLAIFGVAAALQFSIAVAQSLLAIAMLCWLAVIVSRRERFAVPRFFWLLAVYGALTLVSAAFSSDPVRSFIDSKQLVLFLIVPLVYRFVTGQRGVTMITL